MFNSSSTGDVGEGEGGGVAGFWPGTETSSHSLGDLEHRIVCDGGRDKGCLPVCAIVLGADHHTPITEGIM